MSSKFAQAAAAAKEAMMNQSSTLCESYPSSDKNVSTIKMVPNLVGADDVGVGEKSEVSVELDDAAFLVSLTLIDVEVQVRRSFDTGFIQNLASNIKAFGQLQAVNVVKKDNGRYRLISGENRFRALCHLSKAYPSNLRYQSIRVTLDICDDDTDRVLKQFHENVQRNDLNPLDEARAIVQLRDSLGLKTEREIAAALNISQKRVNRRLNLLAQPEMIQEAIASGKISFRDLERGNVSIVDELVVNEINGLSSNHSPTENRVSKQSLSGKKVVKKKQASPNVSLPFSTVESMVTLLVSLAKDQGLAPIDVPENAKGKDLAAILALRLNDIKGVVDATH